MTNKLPLSDCHGAPMIHPSSDEGTKFRVCTGCNLPCDPQAEETKSSQPTSHKQVIDRMKNQIMDNISLSSSTIYKPSQPTPREWEEAMSDLIDLEASECGRAHNPNCYLKKIINLVASLEDKACERGRSEQNPCPAHEATFRGEERRRIMNILTKYKKPYGEPSSYANGWNEALEAIIKGLHPDKPNN